MITQQHILGLDDSHLLPCGPKHRLQSEASIAFLAMQQAAAADGVDCQLVSSYRSFAQQQAIWHNKWLGHKALLDINEQVLDINQLSPVEKLHAILTWSALPGASRHHWGTDMDVYDEVSVRRCGQPFQLQQREYTLPDGPCYNLTNWLSQHAGRFGFVRPYRDYRGGVAAEPWHLSYQPLALQIEQQLSPEALQQALVAAEIDGLDSILANFSQIYARFVLNQGITEDN